MGLFNNFPYTNFHELNLDWLLKKMKELEAAWYSWKAVNQIVFADPVDWSTSNTYAQHVIVIHNGIGYLSRKPVPAGVNISDGEYWEQITNFGDEYSRKNHLMSFQGKVDTTGDTEDYVQTLVMNDTVVPIRDAASWERSVENKNSIDALTPKVSQSTNDLDIVKDGVAIYTGEKTIAGVQAAINALPAHSTLILPRGNYDNSASNVLTIPYPMHLQGGYTGFNDDGVTTFRGYIVLASDGVQISNLAINGKGTGGVIQTRGHSNCYFEHIVIYGGGAYTGFNTGGAGKDNTFVDCHVENCGTAFSIGGSSENAVEDMLFIDCYANDCSNSGISADYANGTTCIDCSFENIGGNGYSGGHGSTTFIGCVFSAIDVWAINVNDASVFVEDCRFAQCNNLNNESAGCIYNSNSEVIIFNSTVVDGSDGPTRALMRVGDGGAGIGFGNSYRYSMWGSEAAGFGLKDWNSANVIGHSDNTKTYADISAPTSL